MRVGFLTHNLRHDNGAGVFSRRLIAGVKKSLNCEVVALTTIPSGDDFEKPIIYPGKRRLLMSLFAIRRVLKDCDVIHALDGYPYGVVAVLASLGLKKKIIITAVGTGSINPLYRPFYSRLLKYSYRKANRVTAISRFTKNEILKRVPNLDIEVINHGVDFKKYQAVSGSEKFSKYQPYILSVGSLRWRKGYHLSIPAFAKVSEAFPDLKYLIVGKRYAKDYYDRLNGLIGEYNLKDKVILLDSVDKFEDLVAAYRGAELFCLLSQNIRHDVEGFGLVFLEAAAAGLPVVGSKGGGVEDAVLEGENGLLVPETSQEDFAGAIIKILRDRAMMERMSAASLRLANSFDWSGQISKYIDLYRELS